MNIKNSETNHHGLPSKLRVARALKGWTILKLEEKSGVRRKTISNIEKGITKNVRSDTISKLLKALEISEDFIDEDKKLDWLIKKVL